MALCRTRAALIPIAATLLFAGASAAAQSFQFTPAVTPDPGPFTNIVSAVAAPSDDEAWAVGNFLDAGAVEKTLALRFDGATWSVVPSASVGTQMDDLTGVAAAAPGDVWAVGGSMFTDGSQKTLVEHWDGTQFAIVPSPNPGGASGNNRLNAVVALAGNDVWAAGEFIASGVDILPLIEHYDGMSWKVVAGPSLSGVYFVNGMAAVGPADIWAVGYQVIGSNNKTFSMHWNGVKWSQVATPSVPAASTSAFKAVGASPSGVVYAVGSSGNERTLAERWNGSAWTIVPTVDVATQDRLFGVLVHSASDVLVVGSSFLPSGFQKTLAEWFDGNAFQVVPSPNPDPSNTPLAIAAPPCGPAWIAGGSIKPPKLNTLVIKVAGPGGPVVDLGGGCGAGGTLSVLGPVAMGSSVSLQLSGADPGATLGLLNISTAAPTACSPCALVPYQLTVLLPLTSGAIGFPAAVPCDPAFLGASVTLQWTVGPTAATGCPLLGGNRALSNAVKVTVGL